MSDDDYRSWDEIEDYEDSREARLRLPDAGRPMRRDKTDHMEDVITKLDDQETYEKEYRMYRRWLKSL